MLDRYGRRVDYARISITDRCNLRCTYCMPGRVPSNSRRALSSSELLRVCRVLAGLGVSKIKLTGGEPLLY